ncbi:Hypothetical Protein SLY_0521 [Strawberry lethal yellows phytoplasma (CPA) str. NZSb11]|uniref:Uncharacterized protein n=1 Tax=Strawberry lethal yellows phytoplasma (CPA) str. NZSb11 TaxID=980422 RepID=R4RMB4_PHYAS|nr:Hypothetical Protein SLY_0521 [Strawberry lethal yellows phytoplasma (CPA) str. NZSb11]
MKKMVVFKSFIKIVCLKKAKTTLQQVGLKKLTMRNDKS